MRGLGLSLRLLTAALQGHPPEEKQWPSVVKIASRTWLCPALLIALTRASCLDEVPVHVRDYLAFLHERNRERNRRLRAQLIEALGALNARGIEPTLLKGAIHLFLASEENIGARMMGDLDLSVQSSEMVRAQACLEELGYTNASCTRGMGRPKDAGLIELHDRPSTVVKRYLSQDLRVSSCRVEQNGAIGYVPSPTGRALHLVVHDMIKEGDYWRFRMDLRHLHDLYELSTTAEGIHWQQIGATMSDRVGRAALKVQATALYDLFGVPVPSELRRGTMVRFTHVTRVIAGTEEMIGAPVRLAGNLIWGVHRLRTAGPYRWQGSRDLAKRVYRMLLDPPKGSRL